MLDEGCWDDCVVLSRRSVCIDGMSAKMPKRRILVGVVVRSVVVLFTVEVMRI
jgi:hypothetical protein